MTKNLLAGVALAGLAFSAHADTLVQWTFEGLASTLSSTGATFSTAASTGTGTASGVHVASATTYSSPSGNGSARSLSATQWAVGDYWQFSFSSVGYTTLSVAYDQTGSNTGPRDFQFSYSTDGTSFTNVGSVYALINGAWSASTPVGTTSYSYDLSAITALNNNATVFLRVVDASTTSINAGTVATTGTSRVDNFTVIATPVPEASTTAMLMAGLAALGFIAQRRRA